MLTEGTVNGSVGICNSSQHKPEHTGGLTTHPTPHRSPLQLYNTLLSSDGSIDPEVLAINAGSAALLRSGVPWGGPVG